MSISFKGDLDDKFNQIIGSQSKINLVTSDVLTLNNFYTGDERLYRVNLYINSVLEWTGFVTPDSAREPFLAPPYNATLTATDLLGSLKKVPYLDQSGSLIKKVDNIKNILLDCLAKTGLDLGLNIGVNTYEDTFLKGDNDCPLEQAYIDTNRFIDTNKKAYSCYDVIMHLCNEFTANIKQAHGAWWFVDIDQLRGVSYRVRQFNKDGQKLGNVLISNIRKAGYKLPAETGFKTPLSIVERDHETQNIPGYKSVTTYYQYGYLSNKLLNGDLNSVVTGPLLCPFENWYSLGGLVIGQGEKTEIIDNTNVPKPNGDKYAIIVNNQGPNSTLKVDMNKGMYTAPVSVLNTNRINITVGIGTPVKMSNVAGFFTVKLTGVGEADHYWNKQAGQWQTEKIAIGVGPTSTSRDEVQLSFQMSPPPFSGFITFYIHGAASFLGGGNTQFFFNNVSIQFDESQLNKSPLGLVNIVNQIESYSESPEPIVLLFGDDTEAQRTSWMRNATGVATKTWNGGKSLQSIVGRNILTQYQKTSRLFEGTFKGGASPLDVIQIDLIGGSFFFLSGEFFIKSGHAKLTLAELFIPDLVPINENSFLDYGDFKDKDGNGVGSSSGINIPPFIPSIDPDSFIRNQSEYQTDAQFNVNKGVFKSEMIAPLVPSAQVGAVWIGSPSDIGGTNPPAFVLEPATTSKLGGVIIGSGLVVDSTGRISVVAESPLTFSSPLVRTGNNVAIVEDGTHRFVSDAQVANWNTAYGWGNHAGLYKPNSYVPTWAEITGKPGTFTPSAHTHVWADITNRPTALSQFTNDLGNYGNWLTKLQGDSYYEPIFGKNSAFNKNFGTAAGTVAEGNHNHAGVYEPAFGILPVSKGGTGSAVRNFVDFVTDESINGFKTFVNGANFSKDLVVPLVGSVKVGSVWIGTPSDLGGSNPPSYVLAPATTTTLGGVIIGGGLSVDAAGRISVNAESPLTFSTPLVRSGNNVAIVQDANNRFVTDAQINAWFTKAQADSFYAFRDGSNASGTWFINITGTAYAANVWNGYDGTGNSNNAMLYTMGYDPITLKWAYRTAAEMQSFLGLGSGAYNDKTKLWAADYPNEYYISFTGNGAYWRLNGSNATGVSVSHSDLANNAILHNGWNQEFSTNSTHIAGLLGINGSTNAYRYYLQTEVRSWLGLGSLAYRDSIGGNEAVTDIANKTLDISIAQMLRWKNYGNGHVIFDASAGTAPNGTTINQDNSQIPHTSGYPTLMGWNGANTYGVRVDQSRNAERLNNYQPDTAPTGSSVVVRDPNGYVNATYFNMSAPIVDMTNMTDIVTTNGNGYLYRSSAATVRTFLGLDIGSTFHRYNTFTADANTVPENTSNFSYSLNAPWNGYLGHFGANGYGLQLSANYNTGFHMSFRTRNGDAGEWNNWRELLWNGFNTGASLNGQLAVSGGTGTAYNSADLQIIGTGRQPNIALHWAGVVASQITIASNGAVAIMNNPGTGYENLIAAGITATSGFYTSTDLGINWNKYGTNLNSNSENGVYINSSASVVWLRLYASGSSKAFIYGDTNGDYGFLNGSGSWSLRQNISNGFWYLAGVVNSEWYRSTGAVGWYNETYGGGINMTDTSYVRVSHSKAFWVDNQISATEVFSRTGGFKSENFTGLVGNYDTAGNTDKIIWTIGGSWNTLANMYGLGYDFASVQGFGHSLFMAESGVKRIHFSLSTGGIYSVGTITGNELKAINRMTIPVAAPTSPVPGDIWIG